MYWAVGIWTAGQWTHNNAVLHSMRWGYWGCSNGRVRFKEYAYHNLKIGHHAAGDMHRFRSVYSVNHDSRVLPVGTKKKKIILFNASIAITQKINVPLVYFLSTNFPSLLHCPTIEIHSHEFPQIFTGLLQATERSSSNQATNTIEGVRVQTKNANNSLPINSKLGAREYEASSLVPKSLEQKRKWHPPLKNRGDCQAPHTVTPIKEWPASITSAVMHAKLRTTHIPSTYFVIFLSPNFLRMSIIEDADSDHQSVEGIPVLSWDE